MNEQQTSNAVNAEKNVKKAKISMFFYLIFYPAITIIIAGWAMFTGKAQALDKLLAAQISVVFSVIALIIEIYASLTLPDKKGYNIPPGNVRVRFGLRVIEVASIFYVAVPAVSTLGDSLLGFKKFLPYPYNWLGLLLFIPGFILGNWTSRTFISKGQGTTIPFEPTQKLIVEGPYKYIRNPMVVGSQIVIGGLALILSSYILLILVIASLFTDHFYASRIEEKELELRFGQEYLDYKARVPRWIPRIR
jgi:protein-S-isoprenylcysteine O-methyltransferase Ste14